MERTVFHVDVNSAFLSWEAIYHKEVLGEEVDLRECVSVVGGDVKKRHGVVLAKSISASKYGIVTGEPIVSAVRKYPELIVVPPHYDIYAKCSKALMDILKEYTPIVEQYSIDEAFMDMTGTEGIHGDLVELAYKLKKRIQTELGFTVNIGVSTNKVLAKMAGELKKPNLVHTMFPSEIGEKMWRLPVGELFFVGKSTERVLKLLMINTIGELANTDKAILKLHLKKQGEVIYNYANGIDNSPVNGEKSHNKGYGNSITLSHDIKDIESAKLVLLSLCETVASRLRIDKVKANCISVTIVDNFFEKKSHQVTVGHSICSTKELYDSACRAFDELWDHKSNIRLLGVATSKLDNDELHQFSLFETPKSKKAENLDIAIDAIREKFGNKSVTRASLINITTNKHDVD